MRKPGRVLYSSKAIRAILFPLSFAAARRASIRYRIRKLTTSAIDDMVFILEHGDATTRRHVEREVGRIARKAGIASIPPDTARDSAGPEGGFAAPDADHAEAGREAAAQDGQPVKSRMEQEIEDSLW